MSEAVGPAEKIASGLRSAALESPVPNTDMVGRVVAETGVTLAGESPCVDLLRAKGGQIHGLVVLGALVSSLNIVASAFGLA